MGSVLWPACEECGYDLRGLATGADAHANGSCPECGAPFHADSLWMRQRWPSFRGLALLMCGPAVFFGLVLLCAFISMMVRRVVSPIGPLLLPGLFGFAIFWPPAAATTLAKSREPRRSRRSETWKRILVAVAANAAFAGAIVLITRKVA